MSGERVRVTVGGGTVRVLHAGQEVAMHAELAGRRGRVTDDAHLARIAGTKHHRVCVAAALETPASAPALLRPLAEYEAAVGGRF